MYIILKCKWWWNAVFLFAFKCTIWVGGDYLWNTNVHFQRFFFCHIRWKEGFWNETAPRIKRFVKYFLFFLIKATPKLALKMTLWSNPHHSCKESLFVGFKVLFFLFTLLFRVCAFVQGPCLRARGESRCRGREKPSPYERLGTKKINSYLQTPVCMRTPWKGASVGVCAQNTHSCRATESEGQQMKVSA